MNTTKKVFIICIVLASLIIAAFAVFSQKNKTEKPEEAAPDVSNQEQNVSDVSVTASSKADPAKEKYNIEVPDEQVKYKLLDKLEPEVVKKICRDNALSLIKKYE